MFIILDFQRCQEIDLGFDRSLDLQLFLTDLILFTDALDVLLLALDVAV